ncbi:hypothetical protein AAG570_010589, partial [Ranatra chinensis]
NTVSLVNKLLNEVETREKGLQLLQVFLPQCDLPVLSANIVSWMSQCLKGVSQKQNNNPSSTSLQVLCKYFIHRTIYLIIIWVGLNGKVGFNFDGSFYSLPLCLSFTRPKNFLSAYSRMMKSYFQH